MLRRCFYCQNFFHSWHDSIHKLRCHSHVFLMQPISLLPLVIDKFQHISSRCFWILARRLCLNLETSLFHNWFSRECSLFGRSTRMVDTHLKKEFQSYFFFFYLENTRNFFFLPIISSEWQTSKAMNVFESFTMLIAV